MNLKIFIIRNLIFSLFYALTLAENERNDCIDIEDIDGIYSCKTNENGELEYLKFKNEDYYTEDFVQELLSFDTIKTLIYHYEREAIWDCMITVEVETESITGDIDEYVDKRIEEIYKEIENRENTLGFKRAHNIYPIEIKKNMDNLEELQIISRIHDSLDTIAGPDIEKNSFLNMKNLKKLYLDSIELNQDNIDEIASLENLERIEIINPKIEEYNHEYNNYTIIKIFSTDFSKLKEMSNLKYLKIDDDVIIDECYTCTTTTTVTPIPITTTTTTIPPVPITTTPKPLPTSANDRCGEKDGVCPSGKCCSKYGWCGTSDDHCSIEKGCQSEFGKCTGNDTTSTVTPKPLPTSTNDRCGEEDGVCPSGKCCSKYGWCGTSDDHCSIEKGCQSEFGKCAGNDTTSTLTPKPLPTSTNDRCGEKDGVCPSGKCCSKYGWCGTSDDHCSIEKGCQSEFGKCAGNATTSTLTPKPLPTSTNDRCGEEDGVCPSGKCCSKYGWCGTSDDHCSIEKGCQSEFGKCSSSSRSTTKKAKKTKTTSTKKKSTSTTSKKKISTKKTSSSKKTSNKPLPTSSNDRCGKEDGVCPSGQCCSKYGWCGTSDSHCSIKKGCQSAFGKCN